VREAKTRWTCASKDRIQREPAAFLEAALNSLMFTTECAAAEENYRRSLADLGRDRL
jgi:hypothetical protein